MATQMSDDNFCVIFGWMCNGLNLSGNELLIYAVIYGFSQDGESRFYGGRGFLSRTLNISKPTVDKALKALVDKGFIHRVETERNGVVFHEYSADLQVVKNLYHPPIVNTSKESLPSSKETLPSSKNTLPSSKESLPNNKDITNPKETNTKVNNKHTSLESILDEVPVISNTPTLRDTFLDFIEMRKAIKHPMTEKALKLAINRTYEIAGGDPVMMQAVLDQSIMHSWQGVFPLKDNVVLTGDKRVSSNNPFAELYMKEVGNG